MFHLLRIAYSWLTISLLAMAALVLFGVDENPSVSKVEALSHRDIARAKQILDRTFSAQQKIGAIKTISLTKRDLNIASNYLLKRYVDGSASVQLRNDEIHWAASLKLPQNAFGRYVNLKFRLKTQGQTPLIKELSIGNIQIPQEFAGKLVHTAIKSSAPTDFHSLAGEHIKHFDVNNNILKITYRWSPAALNQIKTLFANNVSEDLLLIYHKHLVEITRQPELRKYVSLNQLLEPLFKVALQRSKSHNPIEENRALILVLGAYVNGRNLSPLVSETRHLAHPQKHSVMINKRIDTAQHFMISASIAVISGTAMANVVGLYKEIMDSKRGSGFSFIDLAADRAGTRFGDLLVSSPEHARKVQDILAYNLNDRVYMPQVSDLPESLKESALKKRFGVINSPAYKDMIAKIDRRISSLDLYQSLNLN